MRYEQGELEEEETIELFQHLIDVGLVWQLQGSYGRTAQALIEQGRVRLKPVPYPDFECSYILEETDED
jgi:hypothetical protein